MSEPKHASRAEVDEILSQRRKPRGGRACYPCAKRKVRCDSSAHVPCTTCTKRGHPEICSYDPGGSPRGRSNARRTPLHHVQHSTYAPKSDNRGSGQRHMRYPQDLQMNNSPTQTVESSDTVQPTESATPISRYSTPARMVESQSGPAFEGEDSYIGENSAASLVRGQLAEPDGHKIVRDIRPMLGLQNTSLSYPYMARRTPDQMREEVSGLLPRSEDILRYFHFFRTIAYHFNPIIVDIDEFESYVCFVLERVDTAHHGDRQIFQHETLERDIAQIGLLLATLASGTQYCHMRATERIVLSQDFARRSFHCLKLANYLLRPSMEVVQALLILGHVLQNEGQSDGAWAFLGTTVRLAQCLGLHTDKNTIGLTDSMKSNRKHLWRIVMWQDSLLSLCYDRPPAVATYNKFAESPIEGTLDYKRAMFEISKIGIYTLTDTGTANGQVNVDALLNHVLDVEHIVARVLPHLQSSGNCSAIEQRQQHFAFRLQTSFLISIACRPAFRVAPLPSQVANHALLIQKGKASLINATKAFLDLHLISVWARRSWSMTHEGLSSALLLGILGETHRDEVRELQQRLIDVLTGSEDPKAADVGANAPWLTRTHLRALRALRATLKKSSEKNSSKALTSHETLQKAVMNDEGFGPANAPATPDEYGLNDATRQFDMDFLWSMPSTDLSPFSYFDSLLWD